jgi:hypothetical protein
VVKFPINIPEDLLAHGEHDSSLKFVLIPLFHKEKKKNMEGNQYLHLFGLPLYQFTSLRPPLQLKMPMPRCAQDRVGVLGD